ncbi:hypothetical protein [Tenacibaculum finnmarkense]|uniref:hypothetical protein n=1 Tax=Tenacibaculum finnmarkense TaxID=2781243 RepID=UPI001E3FA4E3|nr:hypothetical protein [Tenacibaculum finnmarkense]MCD8399640.1 hypothetical protein [Tenacibaculum finnmarkense genomovar ulcerans]MCG8207138.1 hypothetical protein [Tenacibaculum finnmarkense genomovar finnmarkense]MCG8722626.1 hypothetical protein [Tenacibaculum finnmarkense]MCG8741582.1 hypothetical protein [Tenacibaculum finnmarkense]MCG8764880.1 hypothetical protein [Tenacibaculum finnmarkense]
MKLSLIIALLFFGLANAQLKPITLDEVVINSKVKKTDLYIHKLIGIDSIVKLGTRIIPYVTIGNKGNVSANKKHWGYFLYIDDKLVSFARTSIFDLKSGETLNFKKFQSWNKQYGSFVAKEKRKHYYKLVIKTKRKLKEFDKKNNILEGSFIVE